MNPEVLLEKAAQEMGIELNTRQNTRFQEYMNLLLEWNQKMNLTAITDKDDIVLKHFIDSLTCSEYVKDNHKLADVGTGAGFPGIPLKIFLGNQLEVHLMDSLAKRLKFLDVVIKNLELEKVETIHGRAEDIGANKEYREKYDVVVSRAVANLGVLAEYCIPLVKVGGIMLSMKGGTPEEEADSAKKAIEVLGGKVEAIDKIKLPMSDIVHSILVIRKIKSTPFEYPRKAGKVDKNPIK